MTEEAPQQIVPLSRLAKQAIGTLEDQFRRALAVIVQMDVEDRGLDLPPDAILDLDQKAFLIPAS